LTAIAHLSVAAVVNSQNRHKMQFQKYEEGEDLIYTTKPKTNVISAMNM